MFRFSKKFFNNQSGGMLPFFAVFLVLAIGITALVIDQGRALLIHRHTEDLADAIALAAVSALDGTQTGWQNSKRMALIVVNESLIHGINPEIVRAVNEFGAGEDPWEIDENFTSSNLSIGDGKINITIERGFYRYSQAQGERQFVSLEGENQTYLNLPKFFVANSIKATVEVTNTSTPLANVFNQLRNGSEFVAFNSIVGQSLTIRNRELEFPVAPIAIPACELLADLDVSSPFRYLQDGISGDSNLSIGKAHSLQVFNQCQREVVAREPAALDGDYQYKSTRIDGNLRSDSYPRPPLAFYSGSGADSSYCYKDPVSGLHINCKAMPLGAVLGTPGAGYSSSESIGVNSLVEAVRKAQGAEPKLKASVGMPFNPIADDSFLDNGDLDAEIAKLINDGEPFRNVFYDEEENPKPNFPFRRNLVNSVETNYTDPFAEMRITWVAEEEDQPFEAAMLMANSGDYHPDTALASADSNKHLRYTNPMCHTNTVPFDDDLGARAKTVNIMLIASETEPYCDFASRFGNDSAPWSTDDGLPNSRIEAVDPISTTNPIVVGYIQAHIFDYRIKKYDEQEWWLGGPNDPDEDDIGTDLPPANTFGNVLTDDNQFAYDSQFEIPGLQEFLQDAEVYANNKADYLRCESCRLAGFPQPECEEWLSQRDLGLACPTEPEEILDKEVPDWYNQCFGATAEIFDLLDSLREFEALDPYKLPDVGIEPEYSCRGLCGGKYEIVEDPTATEGMLPVEIYWTNYDVECVDEMMREGYGTVCGDDYLFKNYLVSDALVEHYEREFGCNPFRDGCPCGCNEIPNQPLLGESCEQVCSNASDSFFPRCVELCNRHAPEDGEEQLRKFLATINELIKKFGLILDDRYMEIGGEFVETVDAGGVNGTKYKPDLNLENFMETTDGARDVCLPRRLNDCYDLTNPDCWEDPKPRESGWGCGGIRMRLSCDSSSSLTMPVSFAKMRPAIVGK